MTRNTNYIEIDGFQLNYTIEGTGPNALVIGSHIYYPRTFSQNLRNKLKLIFTDHRGFSNNQTTDINKFNLELLINDIETIRTKLNLGKIIIIGHSGHGYLALEYAKKYPQNVSHVILIALGPDQSEKSHKIANQYFEDSVNPEQKKFLEESLQQLHEDIKLYPEKRFISFCIKLGAKSWYNYKFDSSNLWKGITVNNAMFDHVWGQTFAKIDITQGLDKFDIPVFLGLGHFDFLVAPFFCWNEIRAKFKNLKVAIFPKSGHTPQYEEPELFDNELLDWINKNEEKINESNS